MSNYCECNKPEEDIVHISPSLRSGFEYHLFKLSHSGDERPFCEGCDKGVVNGKLCELCNGTGYKERRKVK